MVHTKIQYVEEVGLLHVGVYMFTYNLIKLYVHRYGPYPSKILLQIFSRCLWVECWAKIVFICMGLIAARNTRCSSR